MDTNDTRLQQLTAWVYQQDGLDGGKIAPASADASFRRYFRITKNNDSFVLMDAPPEQEDTGPFIDVTTRLEQANVPVPHIFCKDTKQGFLRLSDLGSDPLLSMLNSENVDALYSRALTVLSNIQKADRSNLPNYDHAMLHREMELFPEWFLSQHLGITLSSNQESRLQTAFEALAQSALKQPVVFVHRDYHSRNLMLSNKQQFGVIDYQDAVSGPITYDAVSLLRDCYIQWPKEQVDAWALGFKEMLERDGSLNSCDNSTFLRWFDLMGIQRHLKAIGIFARLNHRDGKPGYLHDIPRTLSHILDIAPRHPETKALAQLFCELDLENKAKA